MQAPLLALVILVAALAASGGAQGAQGSPGAQPSTIDRIEVIGVTVFGQADIEESIEVAPGDKVDRSKVVRTAENLQELYHVHGYEQVNIKTRFFRKKGEDGSEVSVLEFGVAEGLPTRVASVQFVADSGRDEAFKKYWKSIEVDLRARSAVAPGDIFDQEKISSGKHGLQDLLASEEYIGAQADDVRVNDAPPPDLLAKNSSAKAGRWVSVEYHVDLGDRVVFGFRGNTVFPLARLNALVEEQRVVGFGKDYAGVLRSRVEDLYRAEGFAQVKVNSYAVEKSARQERHVTFDIDEGVRVTVDSIEFDGNRFFSSPELLSQFYSRAPAAVQHGYYVEKEIQGAADRLMEWIKSRGYLSAKLVTISSLPGVQPKRAGHKPASYRLVIYLYEGDQTRVGSVRLTGSTVFSNEEMRKMLGVELGEPLNLFSFGEGLETVKAAYRARGYLSAKIANEGSDTVVTYGDENRRADISLEFSEGVQYKTGRIYIDGLSFTKEKVVRRELLFREGEVLSETAVAESEAAFRRLGIFSSVAVRLADDPNRPEVKDVHIVLQEGTPGLIAGGPGFRNDFGLRLFGQLAYTNLWGLNHTVSFSVNANHRIEDFRFVEYQAQLAYLYPWFLDYDVNFRPAFTLTGNQFVKFDANTANGALTWEKSLLAHPAVTGVLTYSLERVHQYNSPRVGDSLVGVDDGQFLIGSVIPQLRFDTRDHPMSPTTGWYGSLGIELAAPWLLSQGVTYQADGTSNRDGIGYYRLQGRLDRLVSLPGGIIWYLSYRGGFERNNEVDSENPDEASRIQGKIPLIKQFALGGAGSLRGYGEQELNVQNLDIIGTASYSNYRTQIDFPVSGALRFGPFIDGANLKVDNAAIGIFLFDEIRWGAGLGFHYQTPVGPINFDWAYKLNPDHSKDAENLDRSRFYFSIGVI
ncbi:POTRA domain-containing protein [Bdellovibrionota bacterium FG-1]